MTATERNIAPRDVEPETRGELGELLPAEVAREFREARR
jgi:hypothetical protein